MRRSCLTLLGLLCVETAWAGAPISGRDQQMVFPREPIQAVAARAYHQELASMAKRGELDLNPETLHRIRKICSQLIAQAIRIKPAAAAWPWEIHITSDPEVAAYSMGGGKLMISTHFIESYQLNDEELAVALAHEIGHIIAEHVREQVSMAALMNTSVPLHARKVADVINAMQSDISVYLRLQPLSRLQEMEADDIGIELAARAGISPAAVISFYSKLAKTDSGQSMFDTHGSITQRVKFVDSMANYAWPVYEASRKAKPLPHYTFADASP
ncbi:MAG: M48 family metalloprotease [Gammaproteobacteria bacterium]|nr:M48 family metalloprotease [Gammaproteobacteria bacterium]